MKKKKFWGIAIGTATLLGYGILKLLSNGNNEKYSDDWFDSLSDEEIDDEREKVRQEYCSAKDDNAATTLQNLLSLFDKVIRERKSSDEEWGYPVHTEHGWHLSEDDD